MNPTTSTERLKSPSSLCCDQNLLNLSAEHNFSAVSRFCPSPSAQFRVSGCWMMMEDRAMQEARRGWVEVITRKGSSFQPALCTSSASPFPSRGSDSKRTASVSIGSLDETTEEV